MTKEKWEEIKGQIKDNFTVSSEGKEQGEVEGEIIEFIEWEGKDGKEWRAEWHNRPKIKEKKTIYSHRVGAAGVEQFTYDDEERVQFVKFFSRADRSEEWQEVEADSL